MQTSIDFKTSGFTKRYNIATKLRRNTEQKDFIEKNNKVTHVLDNTLGVLSHKIILNFRGFFAIYHHNR
jgi:hypothetical protein